MGWVCDQLCQPRQTVLGIALIFSLSEPVSIEHEAFTCVQSHLRARILPTAEDADRKSGGFDWAYLSSANPEWGTVACVAEINLPGWVGFSANQSGELSR